MTRQETTPADAVLVAIDVSKNRNDILIEVPAKKRRRSLVVVNNRAEHDRFIATLHNLGQPVIAGFETTGNYHRPFAFRLLNALLVQTHFEPDEAWQCLEPAHLLAFGIGAC